MTDKIDLVGQAYVSTFDGRMLIRTSCTVDKKAPMHGSFLLWLPPSEQMMEVFVADEPFVPNNKRLRGKYFKIFEHVECEGVAFKATTPDGVIEGIEAIHKQHGYDAKMVPGCIQRITLAIKFYIENEKLFDKKQGPTLILN